MFRFLRKYNAVILAVGGTLLLITFLVPQAIQRLSQTAGQRGAVVATVGDGEEVSGPEWNRVQAEVELLGRFGINLPGVGVLNAPDQWFLLVREAELGGYIGGTATGRARIQSLFQVADAQSVDQQIFNIAGSTRKSPQFVLETFARLDGILRLIGSYGGSGKLSDRRLRNYADSIFRSVTAEMVVIEADPEKSDLVPTAGQIQEQFEKFRNDMPGEGEQGFGYKLADRVRVEWLSIDADGVRTQMQRSDRFSRTEQLKYWRRHEGEGAIPLMGDDATGIPDEVFDAMLDELTAETLDEIEKFAANQLRGTRRGLPVEAGRVELPTDWEAKKMRFSALAELIRERFSIDLPPTQSSGEKWLVADDLSELEGVGTGTTGKFGTQPLGLAALVAAAREFDAESVYPVQKDVAGPALRGVGDEVGDVYLFRLTDVDPSHAPESVEEVREKVVEDLKALDHYAQLLEEQAAIEKQAEEGGMLSVAMAWNTPIQPPMAVTKCDQQLLNFFIQNTGSPQAFPSNLPVIGAHEETIEAIVDYSRKFPDSMLASVLTEEERVLTVPVRDKLCLLVARITQLQPVSEGYYASQITSGSIKIMLLRDEVTVNDDQVLEAFTVEALKARHGFQLTRSSSDDEGDGGADKQPAS